jgi:hypothetical protein
MIAQIYNKRIIGDSTHYDAAFFYETADGLQQSEDALGGIIFDQTVTNNELEDWAKRTIESMYPEETLTQTNII